MRRLLSRSINSRQQEFLQINFTSHSGAHMQIITIKPVEGRLVRDPETGREVTEPCRVDGDDGFWIRRLADGDVAEVADQPKVSVKENK
jgi:hypothetical protein